MKFGRFFLVLAAIVLAGTVVHAPAFADKGGNGHGKVPDKSYEDTGEFRDDDDHDSRIIVGDDDWGFVREYVVKEHNAFCPPGLAKKNNGCLPPGQVKRYQIGAPLPSDVVYYSLPQDVLIRLRPAPRGYNYVRVDTDILLIGEATKKVIDAVTLLSAVGN